MTVQKGGTNLCVSLNRCLVEFANPERWDGSGDVLAREAFSGSVGGPPAADERLGYPNKNPLTILLEARTAHSVVPLQLQLQQEREDKLAARGHGSGPSWIPWSCTPPMVMHFDRRERYRMENMEKTGRNGNRSSD